MGNCGGGRRVACDKLGHRTRHGYLSRRFNYQCGRT